MISQSNWVAIDVEYWFTAVFSANETFCTLFTVANLYSSLTNNVVTKNFADISITQLVLPSLWCYTPLKQQQKNRTNMNRQTMMNIKITEVGKLRTLKMVFIPKQGGLPWA